MCLYNNPSEVKKVLEDSGDVITCWKMVAFQKDGNEIKLVGPYQKSYVYKVGENKANFDWWSRPRLNKSKYKNISQGIHVYKKRYNVAAWKTCIRVTALKSDLLGVGRYEMVFKKIKISKQSYKNAIKKAKQYFNESPYVR